MPIWFDSIFALAAILAKTVFDNDRHKVRARKQRVSYDGWQNFPLISTFWKILLKRRNNCFSILVGLQGKNAQNWNIHEDTCKVKITKFVFFSHFLSSAFIFDIQSKDVLIFSILKTALVWKCLTTCFWISKWKRGENPPPSLANFSNCFK